MLLAAPFMEHQQQLHAHHQPTRNFGKPASPGESAVEHEEPTSDFVLAAGARGDDDHDNGSSTLPPSPSSPPQQHMLAPPDFPPSVAAAAAATSPSSASASGPPTRVVFPSWRSAADGNAAFEAISNSRPSGSGGASLFHPGFERPPSHHYHHHRHHHHHQHLHFAASRQFGGGGGSGGPHGGGHHGEDDFEFLRTILLDAGSGTSHAAHNSALPSLGAAGYIPVSAAAAAAHAAVAATDAPFPPMSAAKSSLFSAVSSSPLGAHHSSPLSPSYVSGGGGGDSGSLCFGAAASGGSGRYGGGGNEAVEGPGGYRKNGLGGYHVTEEERLQAADDVARCIWLAGDELREILLARLFDLWSTVEAEMVSYADGAAAAAAGTGGGGGAPRKSFNEVLVERLQATCQAVEAELKAAKARGDDTAFCNPPQYHWRGSGALRGDVLSRLEAYRRENEDNCGMPGSGHGRFSSLNCIDDFERANALARGGGGGDGGDRHRGGHVGGGLAEDGAGDLRQGLETAIEVTRGAVKSELLMFGDDEPAHRNVAAHPARSSSKAGGADRRSAAAAAAAAAVAAAAVAPTSRGVASAERNASKRPSGAVDKSGNKKRKRSGNGRRCKHEGCLLHPHFGLTRPEYCSKHKLPGMFNVKGRRCIHPECTRTPVYGRSGDPHPTFCAAHKPPGYVDIKNPTCREPTCFRQPSFGSASDRKATYCASHMLSGHVNVRRMLASFKSAASASSSGGKKR
ncbi:unnamed protein product [Ectocarpus sp. 12 AP-2014]